MARIPYPDINGPAAARLVEKIRSLRGGRLKNAYRMTLHSLRVAEGFFDLITALRFDASLSGRHRELAILRSAALKGAFYAFDEHVDLAVREGLARDQVTALRAGLIPGGLTDLDRVVIAYTDSMTRDVRVSDQVFAQVRQSLDDRQLLELTMTVASYILVAHYLEAIQIDHE